MKPNHSFDTLAYVHRELRRAADPAFQAFHARLVPTVQSETILGVRIPILRKIAKQLIQNGTWQEFLDVTPQWYEERMLQAILLGGAPFAWEERLERLGRLVTTIDNWAVCDTLAAGFKETRSHLTEMWAYLDPFLADKPIYHRRFGVVMLLDYYVTPTYIEHVLCRLAAVPTCSGDYYAQMAIAWAVSICFVHFPRQTITWLKQRELDEFTYHQSLQKILESYRVDAATKTRIRAMKREYDRGKSSDGRWSDRK